DFPLSGQYTPKRSISPRYGRRTVLTPVRLRESVLLVGKYNAPRTMRPVLHCTRRKRPSCSSITRSERPLSPKGNHTPLPVKIRPASTCEALSSPTLLVLRILHLAYLSGGVRSCQQHRRRNSPLDRLFSPEQNASVFPAHFAAA